MCADDMATRKHLLHAGEPGVFLDLAPWACHRSLGGNSHWVSTELLHLASFNLIVSEVDLSVGPMVLKSCYT